MSDDAEVTMILYADLLPEEENVLKRMEEDIVSVLLENSLSARPIWTGRTQTSGRIVELALAASPTPRVLLELSSSELAAISLGVLLSRLKDSIRRG